MSGHLCGPLEPAENVRGEIVDGELIVSPRPAMRHGRAATKLSGYLSGPFDDGIQGPGGWWIFSEPELHLRGEAFIPDIAGWRVETLPEMPETAACEGGARLGVRGALAVHRAQ
jgi:hypothetical protein